MEDIKVVGELIMVLSSMQDWINRVPRHLPEKTSRAEQFLWVDSHGNNMAIGEDFSSSEKLNSYPVKVYRLRRAATELNELSNTN
jgi:hypothetical protein